MGQGEWERGMEEWGGGKIVLMTQRGGWGSGGANQHSLTHNSDHLACHSCHCFPTSPTHSNIEQIPTVIARSPLMSLSFHPGVNTTDGKSEQPIVLTSNIEHE